MADGWIKFYRKFLDWEWYQDGSMVRLFLHLLLSANHKAARWRGIELCPGQLVTGRHSLSEETGLSERTIRTCIERLKTTGELTIKTTNRFSIITIMNWNTYQGRIEQTDQPSDQPAAIKRPASDQQATTNKKEKKEKKKTISKLTDEEWFAYLKSNLAYQSIDIDYQKAKCEAWCVTKRRQFSRRTFINWLNNVETPLLSAKKEKRFDNLP